MESSMSSENPKSHPANGKPKGITMKAITWLKADALKIPSTRWLYKPNPEKIYVICGVKCEGFDGKPVGL